MLLCIDTGNTNTVFSVWDGTRFRCTLRTTTEPIISGKDAQKKPIL